MLVLFMNSDKLSKKAGKKSSMFPESQGRTLQNNDAWFFHLNVSFKTYLFKTFCWYMTSVCFRKVSYDYLFDLEVK